MVPRPTIELSILGWSDSLILMLMALVVFGPRRLPEIGRQIGKLMYEFRKASNDFKFQMEEELRLAEEADRRKKQEALAAQAAAAQVQSPAATVPAQLEATAPEPPATGESEEKIPRIQPPSSGETVPAARRVAVAAEAPEPSAIAVVSETSAEQEQHD